MSNIIPITTAATAAAALPPGPQLDMVSTADSNDEQQPAQVDPRAHGAISAAMAALAGGPGPLAHARAHHGVHVNSPASEHKPWGSPMPAPPEPAPTGSRTTDDNSNSWGRTENVYADGKQPELARVSLEIGEPLTISVDVLQPPGLLHDTTEPLTIWALVTIGAGSTSITRAIRCDDRFDVPIVATFVQVRAYIGDLDGVPVVSPVYSDPSQQPPAQVSAMVCRGVRSLPRSATEFVSNIAEPATEGVLIDEPCRIVSMRAHLQAAAGGPLWLQFYDATDVSVAPVRLVFEVSMDTATPLDDVVLSWINSRGFSQGCAYQLSSTSGAYTAAGSPDVVVEVERLLL